MSARAIKLRAVIGWVLVMLAGISLPMTLVWKQQTYVRLSRELLQANRDCALMRNDVLVLETEVRSLGQLSRLESVARNQLGLIDPGPPIVIQPEGQILADAAGSEKKTGIKTAFWKGLLPWRTSGF